jgi:hypothetical protein
MTRTPTDHVMIHHAKARGRVVVAIDGRAIDAALVSWRPPKARNRARVEFAGGRQRNVPCDAVALPAVAS